MMENYADKEKGGAWSIYAWCLREAISKHSGIPVLDEKLSLKDKQAFIGLMNGWSDRAEINGQIFQYKKDRPVQDVTINRLAAMRRRSTITYSLEDQAKDGMLIRASSMMSSHRDLPGSSKR